MNEDNNVLCCCEYFDNQQERNHILACCCNCQDLDDSFDNFITGKKDSPDQKLKIMGTFQDRFRIPWYGGARKVPLDILPTFLILTLMLVAAINIYWSIGVCLFMLILLKIIYNYCLKYYPRTTFFFNWTLTTTVILFSIFEFSVVPFLEIFIHENATYVCLVIGSLYCFYFVKRRASNLQCHIDSKIEMGEVEKLESNRLTYCPICQKTVPAQDQHCFWLNCCIGIHNRFLFLTGTVLALAALLYSANLTLTTVCHPFRWYKTILLPDNCSDVYEDFETSLAFISGCYSLVVCCGLIIIILCQAFLTTLGLTGEEWKALPIAEKLCCAFTAHRPFDRGIIKNWTSTVFRWNENNPKTIYHC